MASIKKNYFYNLSYQIISIVVPLITTPYISRVLGAENIGIYSYTTSIATYFSLFLILGMHMYGIREVAYDQESKEKYTKTFCEIQTGKFFTAIIVILLYGISCLLAVDNKSIRMIQGISLLAIFFDISWFFQGLENFKITVFRNLMIKLVGIVLIFILVKDIEDLALYVAIQVIVLLLGNIILWLYLPQYLINPKVCFPSKMTWRTILELFIPLVAVQVYNVLDKLMLGFITKDMIESGYYEQTTKIISLLLTIITSLSVVVSPRVAAEFANKNFEKIKETVSKTYHIVFALSLPVSFGIIAISDNFVPWFLGEAYNKVKILLKIYALVLMVIPFSNIAGYIVLTPTKQHNKGTIAVIIGAIVNFSLNYILIPRYLSIGAAIATIIAEILVSIIHIYYARKYINLKEMWNSFVKYGFCSLIMAICIGLFQRYLNGYGFSDVIITSIQIILGVFVYGVMVIYIFHDRFVLNILQNNRWIFRNKM